MTRFRLTTSRLSRAQVGSRVPVIQLDEADRLHPDVVERKTLYQSPEWRALRRRMLKTRECRKCLFCGAWAEVLEHVVGHGGDAQAVARVLGFPPVAADWRERFWLGPFCGSCQRCARARSGSETAGRLLIWTERWIERRGGLAQALTAQ